MKLADLPSEFTGPAAWIGRDMRQRKREWLIELTSADIADLETAAHHFQSLGRDIGEIKAEDFPLSRFDRHLALLKQKLLHGIGFEVLRGLPVATYSHAFAAAIFCGIGAHLGSARSQNADGHVLGHVRDIGADASDPSSRIYQTSKRQTFHTDSADVVGLLCIRDAKKGGKSLLVSVLSIYNEMLSRRTDLLIRLFDPIATDQRDEVPEGRKPYMEIPPLNWHDGYLTVFYQRQYIDSAQRFDDAMRLSARHVEALDLFDSLADDPELHLAMQLRPGDMQFVYNHSQLHDRTGFTDWPGPDRRRHLFRLWLSIEGDRPLPECFAERYGSLEIGDRGGIITGKSRHELHAPVC